MQDTIQKKTEEQNDETNSVPQNEDELKSWDELEEDFNRVAKNRLLNGKLLKTIIPSLFFTLSFMMIGFATLPNLHAHLAPPLFAFVSFVITGIFVDTPDFDAFISGLTTGVFSSVTFGFVAGILPFAFVSQALGGFPSTMLMYGILMPSLNLFITSIMVLSVFLTGVLGIIGFKIGRGIKEFISDSF